MLTGKDAKKDMKTFMDIDKVEGYFQKGVLKGLQLAIRLVLDVRINLVKVMDKIGVDKMGIERKDEEKKQ